MDGGIVSRRSSRRRARAYQPYTPRRTSWAARIIVITVIGFLLLGAVAVTIGR
jgi:hypothetical protein